MKNAHHILPEKPEGKTPADTSSYMRKKYIKIHLQTGVTMCELHSFGSG
jgi:hypothetical protein